METVLQFMTEEGRILASGNSGAKPPPEGDIVSLDGVDHRVIDVSYYVSTKDSTQGYDRFMTVVTIEPVE